MISSRVPKFPRAPVALLGLLLASAAPLFGQLSITSTSLPQATVGTYYGAVLAASGGITPYTWSGSGSIPPGLTVDPGGAVLGTPTLGGSFSFTATVTDRNGMKASRVLSLVVLGPSLSIATAFLPAATVGEPYNVTLAAAGGTSPYQWAIVSGLPAGLTLAAQTGILSGSPSTIGAFPVVFQVTDSAQRVATATLTLQIDPAPLKITTLAPLFTGTVGVAYSQPFSASGGNTPYTWFIIGNTGGLTLDATTGALSGIPQNRGTFAFTIRVIDAAGKTAAKDFSLTVVAPVLTLVIGQALPSGAVAVPYNQKISATTTGGTPPYQWTLTGAVPPGLSFTADTLMVSGTPQTAGTFTFSLNISDSSGQTAAKSLALTIAPASLNLTASRDLPEGVLNVAYTAQVVAAGGALPYTWSAAGLPDGLRMDAATGEIAGTPMAAGAFAIAITVSDANFNHVSDRFTLKINLPRVPGIRLTGLPSTADATAQYPIEVSLDSPFPAPITGQAILTFAPETGGTDRTVQFASGGTTAAFSIPSGSTTATATVPLALQTGTVAGVITVSMRLQAGETDITPSPAPVISAQIGRSAPVVNDVRVTRSDGKITFQVSGYSTPREVTQATFTFAAANGQTLQQTASSIVVSAENLFRAWFQDAANAVYGSQFVWTQPFTVDGDVSAVMPQAVTLSNRTGSTTYRIQ